MPFWAARISSGSAARSASAAAAWLPEAIASSTLRTKVRTRERRERLITVRFAILRIIFLADVVLAMALVLVSSNRSRPALQGGEDRLNGVKTQKSPRQAQARVGRLIDAPP